MRVRPRQREEALEPRTLGEVIAPQYDLQQSPQHDRRGQIRVLCAISRQGRNLRGAKAASPGRATAPTDGRIQNSCGSTTLRRAHRLAVQALAPRETAAGWPPQALSVRKMQRSRLLRGHVNLSMPYDVPVRLYHRRSHSRTRAPTGFFGQLGRAASAPGSSRGGRGPSPSRGSPSRLDEARRNWRDALPAGDQSARRAMDATRSRRPGVKPST